VRNRARTVLRKALLTLVMLCAVVVVLFPIYWLLLTSVQPKADLMTYPPRFWTRAPTASNYEFTFGQTLHQFFNSLVVAACATVVAIIFGSMSGYAFARYNVGGSNLSFWVLSLKYFPPVVAIVPYFLMMQRLHLIDTVVAVIIPHLIITTPFAVWMIKGFIQEVPRELEEAAMIDGASQVSTLRIVTLPLIAPGLVVTALFCFIWSWNDFMFALILTRNAATTLPVTVSNLRDAHGLMWGEVSSTASLATVPIIVLAIILQKYLVRGLSLGALK
jgi:multiple sugar transport system permease protein